MTLGTNVQKGIKWNSRGYETTEMVNNNCKTGKFSYKLEPSTLRETADFFRLDINTRNGMGVLEGNSNDPLMIATAMAQAGHSPNCRGNPSFLIFFISFNPSNLFFQTKDSIESYFLLNTLKNVFFKFNVGLLQQVTIQPK